MVEYGVFLPNGSNGYLMSSAFKPYAPTFKDNLKITQMAEKNGFSYVLPMVKFRGFGGDTGCWDECLEPFNLVAGLASKTEKIKFFPTVSMPAVHPTYAARMIATLDQISEGRTGLNAVTGWNKPEYEQMGLWPGDEYYKDRYKLASEYVEILRMLWETGEATLDGKFYKLNDCKCYPKPDSHIDLVSAGQSKEGLDFVEKYADFRFIIANSSALKRLEEENKNKKKFGNYLLFHLLARDTDEEAKKVADKIVQKADIPAIKTMLFGASGDTNNEGTSEALRKAKSANIEEGNLAFGAHPCIYGSYSNVANQLNEIIEKVNPDGFMFAWADFHQGIEDFGKKIKPALIS